MSRELRNRSPEELHLQAKGLMESKQIFEDLGIPYYLASGTLLGAYREKDFIPWDWDVQCQFKHEDVKHKTDTIVSTFENRGFVLIKNNKDNNNWKLSFKKYGTKYEFTSWYLSGRWRLRNIRRLPNEFFENPVEIEFYGQLFPAFSPIDKYLEFHYGDWWVPKRESRKFVYNSAKFYSNKKYYRIISWPVRKAAHFAALLIKLIFK